ncbi:hypothetical protein J0X14_12640 [Muricauda sp. CAU 1633]|uniref:hypothetical protein n=1 Tax=Allomuricauda sp. CAU 1633 TaxID=2816036 RepID=UPI001A8E9A1A|nr:hypothetical protein [Muricauda sp. CAU 1633]MBO0323147.1 hypothetical protein [Muricauda sp. CAU 1633]
MKSLNFILLFLLSFIVINCSKDPSPTNELDPEDVVEPTPEEPTPEEPVLTQEVYFTFTTDESFQPEVGQKDWLILHDGEGELLDFRSFDKGDQLVFDKRSDSIPDSFSVTLLKVRFLESDRCDEYAEHYLQTYPEIGKGSIWSYPNQGMVDNDTPGTIGEFKLKVADIPGTDGFRLFDSSFVSVPWRRVSASAIAEKNTANTALQIEFSGLDLYDEDAKYLVSIMDEELNLKYKFFESPMIDETLNFSFDEFQEYDSYAYLPAYPPNRFNVFSLSGQVKGENRTNDSGYVIQEILNTDIQDPIPIGFLDEFDYYKTNFIISFENFGYQYLGYGPKPQIEIPSEPALSVSNTQIADFEMSTDVNYIRKINTWGSNYAEICANTRWVVHSDQNNFPKNLKVPETITEQYDLMKIDELEFQGPTLYLQAESYHDFVSSQFIVPPSPNEIKEYTIESISFTY